MQTLLIKLNVLFIIKILISFALFLYTSHVWPAMAVTDVVVCSGGRQQSCARGSVQRSGQHGAGAAHGRRLSPGSTPQHRGPQGQRRRRKDWVGTGEQGVREYVL